MKTYQATHRQLFRARKSWIFGVCQGLANYFEVSVFWIRLGFLFAVAISALVPMLIIYIVAAIFMKPEPMIPLVNPEDWDFYNSYTTDRKMAISRLREKLDTLDRRTQRIEAVLGSKEQEWEQKMRQA